MSSESSSLNEWIAKIKDGDEQAAEVIWRRFFPQLVDVARKRLAHVPRPVEDEEDVALSALSSFFDAAAAGRFPDLSDRKSLWRVLSRLTQHKAVDLIRRRLRQRAQSGGRYGAAADGDDGRHGDNLADAANQVTPEIAAMLEEESRLLLESLGEPELQQLALSKLQGYTNEEIAQQLGCSLRTIERRLYLIRRKWSNRQED